MIDANTFANSYNAFWHSYAPTCEYFLRRLNIHGVERHDVPMKDSETHRKRAVIAEYSFSIFSKYYEKICSESSPDIEDIKISAWKDTKRRLAYYFEKGESFDEDWTDGDRYEIGEIFQRLKIFFSEGELIITRPKFSGCGFLDLSEGDVICNKVLYEVKTVNRPFRSADLRQLVTYCALNHSSKQYSIETVGAFNPRRGVYFTISLDELSQGISGVPAQDLFANIIDAISSGGISR